MRRIIRSASDRNRDDLNSFPHIGANSWLKSFPGYGRVDSPSARVISVLQTIKVGVPCANFVSDARTSFGCGRQTGHAGPGVLRGVLVGA